MTKYLKAKITKRLVDSLHPDQKGERIIVRDSEIAGFNLLILPTGIRSYRIRYRTLQGIRREPTIGRHGDWTPEQARKRALELRQDIKLGRDPLAEKQEQRQAATIAQLLDRYLDSERFREKAPSTQAVDRGRIERHLKPALGSKYAENLTGEDVKRAVAAIRDGKTARIVRTKARGLARVSGGAGTARMAIELLRAVFSWAISEGLTKTNPCEHIRTGKSGVRETILDDAESYTRLFETLVRMESEARIRPQVADAIRVIALTGARRGEIAGLRWSHVDLKRGLLTLPPHSHKSGRRTGKPRIIGLPTAAQAIVARQSVGNPDDYVFPPAGGSGPISLSKPWRAVRVEAKLPEGIGLHGLRHSLASHMAMGGAEAAEIMQAMGHSQLSTVTRYIHWAKDARQALAERAAAVALSGLAKSTGASAAEVTPLPRKG